MHRRVSTACEDGSTLSPQCGETHEFGKVLGRVPATCENGSEGEEKGRLVILLGR